VNVRHRPHGRSGRRPKSRWQLASLIGQRGSPSRIFRSIGLAAALVIVLLVLVSIVAVLHALRLQHRLEQIPGIIKQAELAAESSQLGAANADLLRAQALLTSTNSSLYNSPDFAIVDILPVARQNIEALRTSTSLALEMIGGGEQILRAASPLESPDGKLEVSLRGGTVPLSVDEAVQSAISQLVSELPTSPPSRSHFVVGKIRSMQLRLYDEAAKRRKELQSVGAALQLVDDIAGASGDHRYLIAVANTAEMRGSGGMILSYGLLTSHAGRVSVGHFGDTSEIEPTKPETTAPFPRDFATAFAPFAPSQDWHNVNLLPDFTVDAPVMGAMYTEATGKPVDGVIQVDPAGLAAMLAAIGPVQTADLGVANAGNVVALTLNTAYFLFPNRTQRQDYTGEVAQAAFGKLTSGVFPSLRSLGTSLVTAGKDRHLLMWTADTNDQAALTQLGFGGALPPPASPFVELTAQNFGGNKLDYYLDTSVTLTGSPPSPRGARVTATIDILNTAPPGQTSPVEVFGPANPTETADVYYGLIELYLPRGSVLLSSSVDATVTSKPGQADQNGAASVIYRIALPAGSSSRVQLSLLIPPTSATSGMFQTVPTPRVIPTSYIQKFS
jgi:Protein of unknown function (DUF4012)